VPQLCENTLIFRNCLKIVRHTIYCWLVVVIFSVCSASVKQLFQNFFFRFRLWKCVSLGICTETCEERFSEGSTSQGVLSRVGCRVYMDLVNKTNYRRGKLDVL